VNHDGSSSLDAIIATYKTDLDRSLIRRSLERTDDRGAGRDAKERKDRR